MDPKNTIGLDPKLKEAYDRVMNTNVPPTAPPSATPPLPTPTTPPMPTTATPTVPTPSKSQTTAFVSATQKAGGGKLKVLLFGIGIIVFLLVYTFIWIKVFKLKVPFLPF